MFRPPAARHRSWTNVARWERVDYNKLSSGRLGESSAAIQQRVEAARGIQRKRFGTRNPGSRRMPPPATPTCGGVTCASRRCKLDDTGDSLQRAAMSQLNLSARAHHRVPTCACGTGAGKLARTIADLAGRADPDRERAML
jgi:magnesium chelatase family protein